MGQMIKRKIIIFLIIGLVVFSSSTVFSKQNSTETKSIVFQYDHPLLYNNDVSTIVADMQTDSQLIRSGYYQIPNEVQDILLPKGAKIESIECMFGEIHRLKIDASLPVTPQARPLNMIVQQETPMELVDPKTIDEWFTYSVGTGIVEDINQLIVRLEIFPARYQPESDTILWVDSIEIDITYDTPTSPSEPSAYDDLYSLLVIGPEEFSTNLVPLVDHKNAREVPTIFVSLSDIYSGQYFSVQGRDDAEKIKYFIKNALDEWGINNVMLVGGSALIPTRDTHIKVSNSDMEIFVSDLYYADIYNKSDGFSSWDTNDNNIFAEFNWDGENDEMDLYPDVYLGRLACVDQTEVDTVVNKIIAYETSEPFLQDWFSKIIVVGGDSFISEEYDPEQTPEGEYVNQEIINILGAYKPVTLWASTGVLSGTVPTGATSISDTINQGAGFIDFSGHGNTNVYATHPIGNSNIWIPTPLGGYFNSNIKELSNHDKLPIVVTGACSVGKFNKDDDCFSWSFVASPNGGGIGSFGSTGLGYAYIGESVTTGLVEKMAIDMFRAYDSNVNTLGEMWSYGIYANIRSRMDAGQHKTVLEWQHFGDPTLTIAAETSAPSKPVITGPSTGKAGREYTYEAVCTDPDGDDVYYLFDWGDGTYSDIVGPYSSGETISLQNIWDQNGEYEVRVAARDSNGRSSDWSNPLPVSMPNRHSMSYQFFERLFQRDGFAIQLFEDFFEEYLINMGV